MPAVPHNNYCLVLGSEKSRDRAILAAARSTNDPIAVMLRGAPVNCHRFADLTLAGDPDNPSAALAAVIAYEERTGSRPNSVVPLTEMSLTPGQVIARHYGLRYLTDATMAKVRDKHRMKQAFRQRGLEVPRFHAFGTYDELITLANELRFPVVIKPTSAGGSEGVTFVEGAEDLARAFADLTAAVRGFHERYALSETMFQVEEYISAPIEISVEVLNTPAGRHVLAVTDKDLGPLPYFVEIGQVIPSIHSDNLRARYAALAACEAVGMDRGVANVEMKLMSDGRPFLLEVNARPPGDSTMDLIETVTGINPFELHCRAFLSDDLTLAPMPIRGRAAIAFLKAPVGDIETITPPDAGVLGEAIVRLNIWIRPGEQSRHLVDSNMRDGSVEFYWPDDSGTERARLHLATAAELSQQIFAVKQATTG